MDIFIALLPILFWFIIFILIIGAITAIVIRKSKRISGLEQRVNHLEQELKNRENA